MRRRTGETLISAFGLLMLLGILVAFDPRVRDQAETIVSRDGAASTASSLATTANELGSAVLLSAKDQSMSHAPLLVFGAAAAVLVAFMLRT